jgi:hypothetical protein
MGLKVNFSDQEAASEGRSFDPIPSGEYYCRVTKVTDKESTSEKNPGKPMYAIEFTVQEGDFNDRKVFTNACLWDGALYTISQLMKSTGFEKDIARGEIPAGDKFEGKEVVVIVKKQRDTYAENRDGDGIPQWKNEVKGIKKYEGPGTVRSPGSAASVGTGGKAKSLLP